ncbi:hypothetical protein PRIPAC_81576 [Pristionchus pacificus]|uniref:Uncharacterized protein n=1 Tax=Pristionchus pacificus TaxID=54126 RepID=A0A2A6CNB9_PRIPA|nr:hypothetical protein PRIPAC_81576 [Pristionchus pacificus]|eukprot:PDM79596.1 hypothetical protein PRIPAC_32175 [Pristionchus pacificus]
MSRSLMLVALAAVCCAAFVSAENATEPVLSRARRQCGCFGQSNCNCGGGGIIVGGVGFNSGGQCFPTCMNTCSNTCNSGICVNQCQGSCQRQCGGFYGPQFYGGNNCNTCLSQCYSPCSNNGCISSCNNQCGGFCGGNQGGIIVASPINNNCFNSCNNNCMGSCNGGFCGNQCNSYCQNSCGFNNNFNNFCPVNFSPCSTGCCRY